jgi:hypothetical protein
MDLEEIIKMENSRPCNCLTQSKRAETCTAIQEAAFILFVYVSSSLV